MTNLEKWHSAHSHYPSPDNWITAGWLFAIASALQRRVWYRSLYHDATFLNTYMVLIGPPAAGKGCAMSQLKKVLFSHPRDEASRASMEKTGAEVPLLITPGPSDGSYQALIDRMAKSVASLKVQTAGASKLYAHSSISLVLPEMNSMFKKNNDQVAKALLQTYDCEDYLYETISRGTCLIKNTCLSMLAGCTSNMLEDATRYGIFDSGFTSRVIFLFESGPRFFTLWLKEMTVEQQELITELTQWIKRLAGIHGQLQLAPDVLPYLAELEPAVGARVKLASGKMQNFYGRFGITLQKIAAAFHFSESLDMTITRADFEKAVAWLAPIERKMTLGFAVTGKNELNHVAQLIIQTLRSHNNKPQPLGRLFAAVINDCSLSQFTEVQEGMLAAGMLENIDGTFRLVESQS